MGKNFREYNIGLDIGTNSVGWCVTDSSNQILKFRGKRMWGVRLFEEGQAAVQTRLKRGQRRRYMRRKERIRLLQELLGSMILSIDENFFIRLEDSFLWREDKRIDSSFTLFADKSYTDSDYYKQYPTIYHLRNYLINTQEKVDPRYIYLALHHIIKYRGNFLYPGQNFKTSQLSIEEGFKEFIETLKKYNEDYMIFDIDAREIIDCLENKQIRKKEKQDEITKLLVYQAMDKKLATEIIKAILGYKFDLSILFNDKEIVDENGKSFVTKFSDAKYDEQEEQIEVLLQDRFELIEKLHSLYSQYVLNDILNGKIYISEAMLEKYNKHQNDLKLLKALVRKYNNDQYNYLFRHKKEKQGNSIKNYVSYIQGDKKCNQEDLYKTIKKILDVADKEDVNYKYCLREMEEFQFLTRLNTRENSAIPWQINQIELEKILDNQSKYYPILNQEKDKIMSLISFRIPYYVGPLNPNTSPRFAWVKRIEEKIYPWNFFDIINEDDTAEKFITKMTNYCTYLPSEKVIPKYSLLYSKYCVLNELANIRINDKKLEPKDKMKMINDLFLHNKRITHNKFCEWLKKEQWGHCTEYDIAGYQKENEFASSLGSFIDFYRIFNKIDSSNEEMIEEIIYWLTIFEEKSIVEKKIKGKYRDQVSNKQLKSILKLRYKGWSSLSKRLLTEMNIKQDEMSHNIMYYLENTKMNFMQIIKDRDLGFYKLIENEQKDLSEKEIKIQDVMELHGSPAIKRGIWQTIKIIQEIIRCTGIEPKNIMLEFARSDEESKRSISRKNKLLEAFKRLSEEVSEYNAKIIDELKNNGDKLSSERLFLYFIQNGKCMYTGGPLNIDELDKYEVDHIIPRCYIKDDSIENKVLVLKKENQRKSDNLLIKQDIQYKNKLWWEKLHKHGLIGSKKFNNLMRSGLSENEQRGFINRQLVETRQICKHVAKLLQGSYVNTNIITVKADLGHLFREKYSLYKNRNINDFHHAQDAYLSAVIGNTLMLNKECDSAEWIYSDYVKHFKKESMSRNQKYGYILSMFDRLIIDDDGVIAWNGVKSLEQVIKVFDYKNFLVTKKLEEGTGQFYDETIYGKPNNSGKKDLIPLKVGLDTQKYGGYSGVKNAYSVAIEYHNKKKIEKKLIGVPVQVSYSISQGKYSLKEYLEKEGYEKVRILRSKVLKYQLIQSGGCLKHITSFQEMNNAQQFIINKEYQQLIAWINNKETNKLIGHEEQINDLYNYVMNKGKKLYSMFDSVWEQIENKIDYTKLGIDEKINLLLEIFKLTRANAQSANLKIINRDLSDRVGRQQYRSGIDLKGITFIDQSITGLFERRYMI